MSAPKPAPTPSSTPLEERLLSLIADNGPMSIGDFMADALSHQQHGYYTTQDPFGQEGDFTTAPEISQLFGELVGAWLVDAWQTIGSPSHFNLVELGPGRGTLMADILRVGKVRPAFLDAAKIFMVENSGRLRVRQQRGLEGVHPSISWVDALEAVPHAPTLLVANEFFDCLPIRQFVRTADTGDTPWRERLVGRDEKAGAPRLCFTLSETKYAHRKGMPPNAEPESTFEECAAGIEVISALASRFEQHKGRALIIDYGHGRAAYGDTFQAVKRHDYWYPLASPGLADVTAHVDFSALSRAGREANARVDGPVQQGPFLDRLGLKPRLDAICAGASANVQAELTAGAERLASPEGMGELFKVMALSSASLPEPPGFS
ncbi:MAG: SAM-dependent methyltransferase [Pseudomonadota bacterium]